MGKNFAIVQFINEDNAFGVVPTKWITDNNENATYYPNARTDEQKEKLLRAEVAPTADWNVYPISVVNKYRTYADAVAHLKKAESTSNLVLEADLYSRKRKMRKIVLPEEEDDTLSISDQLSVDNFKSNCTTSNSSNSKRLMPNTSKSNYQNFNICIEPSCITSSSSQQETEFPILTCDETGGNQNSSDDRWYNVLCILTETIQKLVGRVQSLENKVDSLSLRFQGTQKPGMEDLDMAELLELLPIDSIENFHHLEEKLKEDLFKKKFINILNKVGGKDLRTNVQCIMRRVITDELAQKFSYSGKCFKEAKLPFYNTEMCRSIHIAVCDSCDATEYQVKEAISNWIHQAKTRVIRRIQRKESMLLKYVNDV